MPRDPVREARLGARRRALLARLADASSAISATIKWDALYAGLEADDPEAIAFLEQRTPKAEAEAEAKGAEARLQRDIAAAPSCPPPTLTPGDGMTVLKRGETLYHGTGSTETFELPTWTGFAWFSTSRSVADRFAKASAAGTGAEPRLLEYRVVEDVELLEFLDARDIERFLDELGLEADSAHDLAEIACDQGYAGWVIPQNYPDGDDVLLCDPDQWLESVGRHPNPGDGRVVGSSGMVGYIIEYEGADERWSIVEDSLDALEAALEILIGDRRIARAIRDEVEKEGGTSFRPRMVFADPDAYGIGERELGEVLAQIPPIHRIEIQAVGPFQQTRAENLTARLKRTLAELGGGAPFVVYEDG